MGTNDTSGSKSTSKSEAGQRWRDKPDVPGWYWYRLDGRLGVFRVRQDEIDLWAHMPHPTGEAWQGPVYPLDDTPQEAS